MGTKTIELGPQSHNIIINEILPQLDDMDSNYVQCDLESIPEAFRRFYLNLIEKYPFGSWRFTHKDGIGIPGMMIQSTWHHIPSRRGQTIQTNHRQSSKLGNN